MNNIYRLMGVAAVCVAASLSASAETPAGDTAGAAASSQAPIPTLHCEFKAMSACAPDGDCKEGAEVSGIKVPVKVTVDFENSVVSAVDESGFARTDKFDGVAETADQLVMHGIDGPFWLAAPAPQDERRRLDVLRHGRLPDWRLRHLLGQVVRAFGPNQRTASISLTSAGAIRAGACAMSSAFASGGTTGSLNRTKPWVP